MPRVARQKSETSVYHIIQRGINQVQIFYDDEDRQEFIARLSHYKEACGFELYAYCLMGNHFHLLLKTGADNLGEIMKRLSQSYSFYFNNKYDRSGFLFQGRYKSEAVLDDTYLLTVLRYIHHNPVQAGESIHSWTSYPDYLSEPIITDTAFVLGLFGSKPSSARKAFEQFHSETTDGHDVQLEGNFHTRTKDSEAIEIIKQTAQIHNPAELVHTEKGERDNIVRQLRKAGLTIRQISRLTGINRGVIYNAGKE